MVPLIITMDLEIAYDHRLTQQVSVIENICKDMDDLKIPLTVFTTSEFAEKYPESIRLINSFSNEIGSHGINHCVVENYKILPKEMIDRNIETSGKSIFSITNKMPVCFRGPGMTTSTVTQNSLIKFGYKSDFSVCSQRIDFFNSIGGDLRWLTAPRVPYNPSVKSPYKKGNLPIWTIPLSTIGLPFMSGIMYLFGFKFMTIFFRLLLKESLRTQKPIVYLFHSYEFSEFIGKKGNNVDKSAKRYQQPFLHKLYLQDVRKRYEMNIKLFNYMLSFESVRTFTGNEYCEYLDGKKR